jgi:hypothetical protein
MYFNLESFCWRKEIGMTLVNRENERSVKWHIFSYNFRFCNEIFFSSFSQVGCIFVLNDNGTRYCSEFHIFLKFLFHYTLYSNNLKGERNRKMKRDCVFLVVDFIRAHTHDRVTFDRVLLAEWLLTNYLLAQCNFRPSVTLGRVPLTEYLWPNQKLINC